MRKFLNFVIGGLQQKIFNIFLFTMLIVAGVFIGVITYQSNTISTIVSDASEVQKTSIDEISSSTMDQVITLSMETSGKLQADNVNTVFKNLAHNVDMLRICAERYLSNPDSLYPASVAAPDPANDGKVVLQMIGAEGVDLTSEEVKTKSGILGNLEDVMVSLVMTTELSTTFVGGPDGFFLIADSLSASKYDAEGNIIHMDAPSRWWYKGAVEAGGIYFSDLEKDMFSDKIGLVCAAPVYVDGKIVAVVGADIFLNDLEDMINSSFQETSFMCIVNQDGHVIFAPKGQNIFMVYRADLAVDMRRNQTRPELSEFVTKALKGDTGVVTVPYGSKEYYMIGSLMDEVGWSLIIVLDKEVASAPGHAMVDSFNRISESASETYINGISKTTTLVLVILGIVFVLGTAGAITIANRVVRPIGKMTKRLSEMKDGDFNFTVEDVFKTKDEIQVLAEAFAAMAERTRGYIKEITDITAEKERIGAELNVATHIQADMLPSIFPPYPNKTEFDLFASMKPAKEVGGDFYDFFLVDDDHLAMVIADVSGKGVPAALFMVIAKTLIKNRAQMGGTPSEILYDVNNQLCEGNRTEFFVTVWLAIIDLRTGEGLAANAGHEHPSIYRDGGKFELVKYVHSPVLAAMSDLKFKDREFKLCKGDRLFVYTDGVVEATNRSNELFGEDRLLKALNSNPYASLKGVLDNVSNSINSFVGDAQQFDDITMMCIEYKGSKGTS